MHQICRQLSRLPEICWSSMAFSSFVRKNCSAAGVLNALRTTPAYCSSRSQLNYYRKTARYYGNKGLRD